MNKAIKILILLLLTLSIGATTMTKYLNKCASIVPSETFYGHYDVLAFVKSRTVEGLYQAFTQERIPCANLRTARSILQSIKDGTYETTKVSIPQSVERSLLTPEQLGGCRTGGAGYDPAVTWEVTGRVERVHNWATAKSIARSYPVEV